MIILKESVRFEVISNKIFGNKNMKANRRRKTRFRQHESPKKFQDAESKNDTTIIHFTLLKM